MAANGAACGVSFDSLNQEAAGTPMVAVTFDDGLKTAYDQGYPYLASKGIPGTAYILPSAVGDPGYASLPDLQTMQAGGWDIANHSWDHRRLTELPQPEAQAELTKTADWLVANGLPGAATDVAYPYGAWDANVLAAMAATGMRSGRTTDPGENMLPLLNPDQIKCYESPPAATANAAVDLAVAHQSLVLLLFHEITDTPGVYNVLDL